MMTILEAFIYSLLGMAVVFFALVLLMLIIRVMTLFTDRKKSEPAPAPAAAPAEPPKAAPGSAGELKLYDTEPRTDAMIMAIVADDLGYPVNELRFKSIKKVEE